MRGVIDVATLVTEECERFNSRDEPFVTAVTRSTYALLPIWVVDVIKAQDDEAEDSARLGRRLSDVILPAKQVKLHS
jgi:hypothetical protein